MCDLVAFQLGRSSEPLVTCITRKIPLTSMDQHMLGQGTRYDELSHTHGARKLFHPKMSLHVSLQTATVYKFHTTFRTDILPVLRVYYLMLSQARYISKTFPAHVAHVLFNALVSQQVTRESTSVCVGILTLVTLVRSVIVMTHHVCVQATISTECDVT